MITELNDRSRDILRLVVEAFVETGEPIGSRTLSRMLQTGLSPATVRNVMADLEDAGLLYAPHTSAGRLPTDRGVRLFVDGLLQSGQLSQDDREAIERQCATAGRSVTQMLEEASTLMSGLSRCASLVMAPKTEGILKHIEFVPLGPGRALVVMVTETGMVENRVIDLPLGLPSSALIEATNYLTARLVGHSVADARDRIADEIDAHKVQIDDLTAKIVEAGLGTWSDIASGEGVLIVSGQSNLLEDVTAVGDLERIRALFSALEAKQNLWKLLDAAEGAQGVQIFIGAENDLFSMAGCSLIVAPYSNGRKDGGGEKIVGAIGVLGPTRMNYARIIPMVDYTAKVVGRLVGGGGGVSGGGT
ncbi:heat-inducible transcriptional repressor HrcA [Rhodospirillaceae bacterium KN72]|uniref:Heat-inducible transcription repressor HrcA n=1 Tax=Pacificispira spongiicola TaxID=2729598 RepID=A0A7Y0HFX1_9PROT|nr:heat-inducible transcriptional repressor HrcA [Pacificispira spongiicola]NMM45053.1 heat-inducible transcriptional repressor HrcA [Pacificispira spongiicola]